MIRAIGTDQEAAKALELHRSSVSKLRRGKSAPSFKTVRKLLELQNLALRRRKRS